MFNRKYMCSLSGSSKAGLMPMTHSYWNKDGDTVTTSGYFADNSIRLGDQIIVISADYTTPTPYYVSAVSAGKATVIASS